MTIALDDNTPRISYTVAEGVTRTTPFPVPFVFFDGSTDLNVYVDNVERTYDASTSNTTLYTVTGGNGSTGSVTTTVTGGTGGSTVIITRDVPLARTTDFPSSGAFEIAKLNTELDTLLTMITDADDENTRALRLQDSDDAVSLTLPLKDVRKGTVLGFNATTGAAEAGPTIADVSTLSAITADISTLADIEDGTDATDAIQTVAGISGDVTTVAGIDTDVTTVAGIETDITNVAADATDIGTVATNINDINTVATNIDDIVTVADDLNEAISEIETAANDLNEATSEIDTVASSISNVDAVGTNIDDVTTVAGQISPTNNISTVAGDTTEINTVAGISDDITTVAGIDSDITSVANDATDIGNVSTNITDVSTVAGQISPTNNIATVASADTNITTVAGQISPTNNIATVAGDSADIGTVAGLSTDIQALADIEDGTTATNAISNVGNNITDVTTVASNLTSISSFNNLYRIGATDPTTSLDTGDLFYNTTSSALKVYTGSAWEQGVTAGSGFLPTTGGQLTGNITFSGTQTVDGRDLSVDGAKLDGIASSADNYSSWTISDGSTSEAISSGNTLTIAGGGDTSTSYDTGTNTLTVTTNAPEAFPSGTSMLFQQTSAPTGWTKQTTHDDKALRIVTGTVGTGGSSAFSTALATPSVAGGAVSGDPATNQTVSAGNLAVSISGNISNTTLSTNQIPSHNHTLYINGPNLPIVQGIGSVNINNQGTTQLNQTIKAAGGGGSHNHGHNLSGSMTGSPTLSGNVTAGNLAVGASTASINVNYVDFIIANKD